MARKPILSVGDVFGRQTVIEFMNDTDKRGNYLWKVRCECGNVQVKSTLAVKTSKSCGCLQKETARSHGYTKSPTYKTWQMMKQRCYNSNAPDYYRYGGRGIQVCERWLNSFEAFLEDMGERPKGKTLDRIDGALLYSKETCRWATTEQQQREGNRNCKLTPEIVKEIRRLAHQGLNNKDIINKLSLKVSISTICDIKAYRSWKNV